MAIRNAVPTPICAVAQNDEAQSVHAVRRICTAGFPMFPLSAEKRNKISGIVVAIY